MGGTDKKKNGGRARARPPAAEKRRAAAAASAGKSGGKYSHSTGHRAQEKKAAPKENRRMNEGMNARTNHIRKSRNKKRVLNVQLRQYTVCPKETQRARWAPPSKLCLCI